MAEQLITLCESCAEKMKDNYILTDLGWVPGQLCSWGTCSNSPVKQYRFESKEAARQRKIAVPTNISHEIEAAAMELFRELYHWRRPIRSIGVRVADLKPEDFPYQLSLFQSAEQREKLLAADRAADDIRRRYGYGAIRRGIMCRDMYLSSLDATADDHMVHPHSYLERGNRSGVEAYMI